LGSSRAPLLRFTLTHHDQTYKGSNPQRSYSIKSSTKQLLIATVVLITFASAHESDLEGNFLIVYATGILKPCSVDFHKDFVCVAQLASGVSILDKDGNVVTTEWNKWGRLLRWNAKL
jgi:hypothetical protein